MLLQEKWYSLIGKRLRDENNNVGAERLPKRWLDLIRHLDEEERKRDAHEAEARPQDQRNH
jgi:hypothetical protein